MCLKNLTPGPAIILKFIGAKFKPCTNRNSSLQNIVSIPRLGIKIRKLKMDLNMEALCIGCRNKH